MFDRLKLFSAFIYRYEICQRKNVILSSGKESNFYYNFRKLSDFGSFIFLSRLMTELLNEKRILNEDIDCLFTNAYGGIILTTSLLVYLNSQNIKIGYLRKEKKKHGDNRDIIGHLPDKDENVILVDDVFSTGKSVLEMYDCLKSTECRIKAVIVLVNRADRQDIENVSAIIKAPIFCVAYHEDIIKQQLTDFPNFIFGPKI